MGLFSLLPDSILDLYLQIHQEVALLELEEYHLLALCLFFNLIGYLTAATNNSYYYKHYYQRLFNPSDEMYIENDLFDASKITIDLSPTLHRGLGWWITGTINVITLIFSCYVLNSQMRLYRNYFYKDGSDYKVVKVWDPKPLGLTFLCGLSPAHVLLMMASSLGAGLVGYLAQMGAYLVLSAGCYYSVFYRFLTKLKDRELVLGRVMAQYELEVVQPVMSRKMRDAYVEVGLHGTVQVGGHSY